MSQDGTLPLTGVTSDGLGNYYGTTYAGGLNQRGTIFVVAGDGSSYNSLYSFTGASDGSKPLSPIALDSFGNFYSATSTSDAGPGVLNALDADVDAPLVAFSANTGPVGSVILAEDGYLYGTAATGGTNGNGCLWRCLPSGASFGIVYSFTGGWDGGAPASGVIDGGDGYLYGTAPQGGSFNSGVIFKYALASSAISTIHNFGGSNDGAAGANGSTSGLTISIYNTLYGTCSGGGPNGLGIIYTVSTDGTAYNIVHSFSGVQASGPNDGDTPVGALVQNADGYLYGVSQFGGDNDLGTVFRVATSVPNLTACTPPTGVVGADFTLTVTGAGFVPTSQVLWNGATLPTTYVNSSTLTAQVPAADVSAPSTAAISVYNNVPGGGTSNSIPFQVNADLLSGISTPAATLGPTATGTVTLSAAAPTNGTVVWLSSGSPVVSTPPYVIVPAGSLTADFTMTVSPVNIETPVTITASQGTQAFQAQMIVLVPSVLNVANASGPVNQPIQLTANLSGGGAGAPFEIVAFQVDGTSVGSGTTDVNGNVSVSYTPPLGSVGQHTITATFGGDLNYGATTNTGLLNVTIASTTLTMANVIGVVGQSSQIVAQLQSYGVGVPGETVNVAVDGASAGTATTDSNGNATITYTPPTGSMGNHQLTATFAGDANYAPASAQASFTTLPSTNISVVNVTGFPGQPVTLKAVITSNGTPLYHARLSFQIGTRAPAIALSDATGTASLAWTLPSNQAGTLPLTVTFPGTSAYGASSGSGTITVLQRTSTITIGNITGQRGATITLPATLTANGVPVAYVKLGYQVGTGGAFGGTTNASGVAAPNFVIPVSAPNTLPITVTYAGDAIDTPATATAMITVAQGTTNLAVASLSGQVGIPISLTATLTTGGSNISSQQVAFQVDGKSVGTATTNSQGTATVIYVPGAVGTHTVTATFAGTSIYASSSGSGTLTVTLQPTTLTVANVTGQYKQVVPISATLTANGSPVANAKLLFQVGNGPQFSGTTNASGVATASWTVPTNQGTSIPITATYAGSSQYASSSGSGTMTATLCSTSIAVANASGQAGQTIVISATLTSNGAPVPNVTLQFQIGGLVLSAPTNASGVAVHNYTIPKGLGTATMTVTFAGNSIYAPATGTGTVTGN
jgi:uncharacterized repeat protein (TIGR03803 family)